MKPPGPLYFKISVDIPPEHGAHEVRAGQEQFACEKTLPEKNRNENTRKCLNGSLSRRFIWCVLGNGRSNWVLRKVTSLRPRICGQYRRSLRVICYSGRWEEWGNLLSACSDDMRKYLNQWTSLAGQKNLTAVHNSFFNIHDQKILAFWLEPYTVEFCWLLDIQYIKCYA